MGRSKLLRCIDRIIMKFLSLFWLFMIRSLTAEGKNALSFQDILPADYDKMRPPKNGSDPVNVTLSLYILQLRSVDEVKMSYTLELIVRKIWLDYRFIFPEDVKEDKIVLDPKWGEDFWTPDLLVKNALDMKLHVWIVPSVYYWFFPNKTLYFCSRLTVELSCDMHLQNFPHDSQECSIQVIGLMNPEKDMRLLWRRNEPIRISKLMNLPQYDVHVDKLDLERCRAEVDGESFSCLEAKFHMRRRCGYFLMNTYIPTILIVLMSMLTFWMPPEAVPARITLGVTSLLTIITKQYSSSMPNVSYIIALNVWLSVCIGFVFCSLLEYAVVITIINRKNKVANSQNSDDASAFLPVNQGEQPVPRNCSKDESNKTPPRSAWEKSGIKACLSMFSVSGHAIDMICRVTFPLLFILFCLIYWGHYTS